MPCFSGDSTLEVLGVGKVGLKDIKVGQRVLVDSNKYEPVYSFGHFNPNTLAKFLRLETAATTLDISAEHMIFVEGRGVIPAALVRVGDKLITPGAETNAIITTIKDTTAHGVFAPFTPSGKVVVDGILASSFIAMGEASPDLSFLGFNFSHHWIAHSFEFPHRVVCHHFSSCLHERYTKEGISTWVARPKDFGIWLLDQNFWVRGVIGGVLVGTLVLFNVMETIMTSPVLLLGGLYFYWKLHTGKRD
jgi:hypothetical protein